MDVIAAYREVGTYRGAAELRGTTHKTSSGSLKPLRPGPGSGGPGGPVPELSRGG